jgi:GntR family transcriptional regulator
MRAAADDEAMRLRIATGAPVFELERVRVLDGVPLSLDRSILHPRLAEILAGVDFSTASLYRTLRDRGGIVPTRADVVLRAIPADPDIAELLGVPSGAALLELSETAFDQYGDPFEAATLVNRGDRYAFGTSLGAHSPQRIELGRGD